MDIYVLELIGKDSQKSNFEIVQSAVFEWFIVLFRAERVKELRDRCTCSRYCRVVLDPFL